MKRYEFLHPVALLMPGLVPKAALAEVRGTLCSGGRLGPVACIRPSHAACGTCQHIADASRHHLLDPGFSRGFCGGKAVSKPMHSARQGRKGSRN